MADEEMTGAETLEAINRSVPALLKVCEEMGCDLAVVYRDAAEKPMALVIATRDPELARRLEATHQQFEAEANDCAKERLAIGNRMLRELSDDDSEASTEERSPLQRLVDDELSDDDEIAF